MQLKLNNDVILDNLVSCNGGRRYVQGASRDSLEFQFPKGGKTVEEMDGLFTSENCQSMTIIDGEEQYIHNHYQIRAELSLKPVVITPATSEAQEVTEERICVTMAQLTYSEIQIAALQAQVNTILEAQNNA